MSELQLIELVKSGDINGIRELVEEGADVNQSDEQGWTPLNWASGKGNFEIVKLLVDKGADVFKVGRDLRTPYLIALAAGHAEVVKFLRQAEDQVQGEKPSRPDRKYCKAYPLSKLRQYPSWSESTMNLQENSDNSEANGGGGEHVFKDEDIVFLHQDYTVTQSMWHDENVIFNQVTPEWKEFCTDTLQFKVLDDLDLIVPAKSEHGAASAAASD